MLSTLLKYLEYSFKYLFREDKWKYYVPGFLAGIVLSLAVFHYVMMPFH